MSISTKTPQPSTGSEINPEQPPETNTNTNTNTNGRNVAEEILAGTVKATKYNVDDVVDKLMAKDVRTLTLIGDAGVGKTWMAKQVSESARKKREGFFYGTVWISVDQIHVDDDTSLWESVARQLSLLTSADEWEAYADDKKDEDDSEGEQKVDKESKEGLKKQIEEKHEEKAAMNKHLLFVLDGGELDTDIPFCLETISHLKNCKKLVTRRGSQGITEGEIIKVIPLSGRQALELLETVGEKISTATGFEPLCEAIERQNKVFPAGIMRILGAVNCIAELGDSKLESALTEAANGLTEFVGGQVARKDDGVLKSEAAINAAPNVLTNLLQIEREVLEANCLIDYYWHIHDFFDKHGGVHYNELIVHWMLEGYVNPVDYSRKAYEKEHHFLMAYEKGHNILMKFVHYGLLRLQGDNNIVLQGPKLDLNDERLRGYLWKTNLRLPVALEKGKGLGRIAHSDGLIKTLRVGKEEELVATLLVDGRHLCREIPKAFFKARPDFRVLGIFDSTIKSVPLQKGKMEKLFVLVLRSCHLLKDISPVQKLKELTALEISGATFLKEIPGGLFEDMPGLRSLNLSELGIESLPNISKLTKLQRLILRRCSYLRALPSIRDLTHLVVLNLSGCSSLEKMADGSLGPLQELQIIDFSGVKFPKMPIVHPLKKLKQLLLEGCDNLISLRLLKQLTSLQILHLTGVSRVKEVQEDWFAAVKELRVLKMNGCAQIGRFPSTSSLACLEYLDLSNASSLKDFEDESFDHLKNLQYLNLSNTPVENLPPIKGLSELKVFKLSGCKKLKTLPPLTDLQSLEDLDLSSCDALSQMPDDFFEHMGGLKKPNLSESQIDCLPSLGNSSNLCCLVLRGCKNLKHLPNLNSLRKLEKLDLFGVANVEAESWKHLTQLKNLGLNNIKKEEFSSIANRTNLRELSLSGCSGIESESWEALKGLEVLELSGDMVELPFLTGLSKLRVLSLRGCLKLNKLPSLKNLIHLEVLDLSETRITELPDEISEMAHLKRLHLPDLKLIQDFAREKVRRLPGDLDWDKCSNSGTSLVGAGEANSSELVDGNLLNNTSELLKQRIYVRPSGKRVKESYYLQKYSDVYFKIRDFPPPGQVGQCLEIHGFDDYPTDVEDVLSQSEYVSLVGNKFLNSISDLHPGNMNSMKGCCIQRCSEMKSIYKEGYIDSKTEYKLEFAENLEMLQISSLPNLRSFYEGNEQCFKNLKDLNIDNCPMLDTVFSWKQILENLETLQIKFCDNLKTIFGQGKTSQVANQNVQQTASARKLKHLHICHCHRLETIYPPSQLPEKLETVELQFCDMLQSVLWNKELSPPKLLEVQELRLSELPELTTVGFNVQNLGPPEVIKCKFPKLNIPESTNAQEEITKDGDN